MKYFFQLNEDKFIIATWEAYTEAQEAEARERGFSQVTEEVFLQASPQYQYIDGVLVKPESAPSPEIEPLPEAIEPPRYFFILNSELYIRDIFVAYNVDDLAHAQKSNFTEVDHETFVKASPQLRYVDGSLVFPEQLPAFELRYFIEVDEENYITACYVAFERGDVDKYKGKIELTPAQYSVCGPNSMYVDGKVVEGPVREIPVSAEANLAIQAALIDNASRKMSIWQTKLLMGRKLTDAELASLNAWMDYADLVMAIDANIYGVINWPSPPA